MPHAPPTHIVLHAGVPPEVEGRTYLAFAAAVMLAGGNSVAVRLGLLELPPYWGASLRFLSAALIQFAVIAVLRYELPRGRRLVGVFLYGLLNFGFAFAFIYLALTEITAGTMMVVLAMVPLLTLIFAAAEQLEHLSLRSIAGAVTAMLGIGLVFRDSIEGAPPWAMVAALGAAVCMSMATVVVKKFPRVHSVIENGLGMLIGGGFLLALSLLLDEPKVLPFAAATWLSLLYLCLGGSIVVFLLYLFVIRRMTASGAAYILLLAPLVAVPLGALLLDEPIHPIFIIGGLLVVAGVYMGLNAHSAMAGPAASKGL